MKIKVLRNVGRKDMLPRNSEGASGLELPAKKDGTAYVEGEVADFSNEDGEKFIKSGVGEQVTEPKK